MTITVTDSQTGEALDARVVTAEVARRDGWTPDTPEWVHPVYDAIPAVAEDTEAKRLGYAATVVAYEHARHEQAQWRDLATWCAQTTSCWVPTVTLSRPLSVDELPAYVTWQWQRQHPWAAYHAPEPVVEQLPYQGTPRVDPRLAARWRQRDDAPPSRPRRQRFGDWLGRWL